MAVSANTFCARYRIINNGAQTVAVKIDSYEQAFFKGFFEDQIHTLTAENLQPRGSTMLYKIDEYWPQQMYLLPPLSGKQKKLKLSNEPVTNNFYMTRLDRTGDYTFVLTSKPDPKDPKNLIWTITAKAGIK